MTQMRGCVNELMFLIKDCLVVVIRDINEEKLKNLCETIQRSNVLIFCQLNKVIEKVVKKIVLAKNDYSFKGLI